jgi:hypothetical protein
MQESGCVGVFWDENATFWANIVIIGMRYHISKSTKCDPLFGSSFAMESINISNLQI